MFQWKKDFSENFVEKALFQIKNIVEKELFQTKNYGISSTQNLKLSP